MIKYLVLLFNMLGFLVYQAIFTEGVTINQTVPATAKAGSEFTVELRINKGSVGGFAKLQQDLPEGFTATAIENSGGSFSFTNQSVKIIWASLPSQSELKVSYKITVGADVSGTKTFAGKFSYVDAGNQKQSLGIDAATIEISSGEMARKEEPKTETTGTGTTTPADTSKTATAVTDIKKEEESKVPPAQVITASRVMPPSAMGEFTVEVTLNKGNIAGYCKLTETLPEGFTAKVIDRGGSEFTFVNQVAKFVWVSVPAKTEQLKVSYKVTLDPSVSGNKTIEGLFSYIESDATKKYNLENASIDIKAPEVLATTTTPPDTAKATTSSTSTGTSSGTSTATTTGSSSGSSTETSSSGTSTSSSTGTSTGTSETGSSGTSSSTTATTEPKPVTTVPSAQTNVNYRVQISATHQNVQTSYFTTKYGISEQIYAEMHEGWNKFTVGGFNEYKQARDHREGIRGKGVDGPFVTAYNSGRRITVQEALMITSQKWYR